jgi:hypothetical protein
MVHSQALMQQKGSVVEELDLLESMHHEINRQARPPSQSAVRHTIRCKSNWAHWSARARALSRRTRLPCSSLTRRNRR